MNSLINFRDLGGIATGDGRKIKMRRLLRAGEMVGLTREDKEELLDVYRLKMVVDFRTTKGAANKPDDVLPGVKYIPLDIMKDMDDKVPRYEVFSEMKNQEEARAFMKKSYLAMLMDKSAQEMYRIFLRHVIANVDGAILIHCYAGKDRTGIAAVMVLTLLGVSKGDIMEDYLLTNVLRAKRTQEFFKKISQANKSPLDISIADAALKAQPDYLQHVFDYADEQYGSLLAYLKKELNISDAEINQLKRNYLQE